MKISEVIIETVWKNDYSVDFLAIRRGDQIGHACCTLDGRRMRLEDIKVYDNHRRVKLPGLLRHLCFLGIFSCRRNFRKNGVGTKLLRQVQEKARAIGVEEVCGDITRSDLTNWLVSWYEQQGFLVLDSEEGDSDNIAKKIIWRVTCMLPERKEETK
ncbi:MAG: GNAT family N-acetyltransferase [Phycisphaerales bacterium]|nr:GNAT family N-acetyltransferase [Phycisphaerales bacterium]